MQTLTSALLRVDDDKAEILPNLELEEVKVKIHLAATHTYSQSVCVTRYYGYLLPCNDSVREPGEAVALLDCDEIALVVAVQTRQVHSVAHHSIDKIVWIYIRRRIKVIKMTPYQLSSLRARGFQRCGCGTRVGWCGRLSHSALSACTLH